MKFHRERDQRQALIKSLAESLILQEAIETTLPKAKAVARYTEKLMTHAKKGKDNLHYRRLVISRLATKEAAHKLVDEIAPKIMADRGSGYLRVKRTGIRIGDGAQMAKVSFVTAESAKRSQKTAGKKEEKAPEKEVEKTEVSAEKLAPTDMTAKAPVPKVAPQAPKRTGRRGNR